MSLNCNTKSNARMIDWYSFCREYDDDWVVASMLSTCLMKSNLIIVVSWLKVLDDIGVTHSVLPNSLNKHYYVSLINIDHP